MKALMLVWVLFGPDDSQLGEYTWVSFQYEYRSMGLCLEAQEETVTNVTAREDFRALTIECRPSDGHISVQP